VPRFFFHANDERDPIGLELPGVGEAKLEAVRYAAGLISDLGASFWDHREFVLTVSDEEGLTLLTLHLVGTEAPVIAPTAIIQQPMPPA
jgi:hypothetical protein